MADARGEVLLDLDVLEAMEDDGAPRECACCALEEGRTPKRYAGPSLSWNVMEIAWPQLEELDQAPHAQWLAAFITAALAWNLAVNGHRKGSEPWSRAVEASRLHRGADAQAHNERAIAEMIERKQALFADDCRAVELVRLSLEGDLWCKPAPRVRRKAG